MHHKHNSSTHNSIKVHDQQQQEQHKTDTITFVIDKNRDKKKSFK